MNTYFDMELSDLFELSNQQNKMEHELRIMQEKYNALNSELVKLAGQVHKEEADVVKAKNNFFYTVFLTSKIEKEELEAYVAAEKHRKKMQERDALAVEMEALKEKVKVNEGCQKLYEEKYWEKRGRILREKGEEADRILQYEESIAHYERMIKEAGEAMEVEAQAEKLAKEMEDELYKSRTYSDLDLLDFGTGILKYEALEAVDEASVQLEVLLIKLRGELKDLGVNQSVGSFSVQKGSAVMDIFFDNFITDYKMQKNIYNMCEGIREVVEELQRIRVELTACRKHYETYREEAKQKLQNLMLNT